jgi:phospholipid/cholesterol/gamma-HCH transport system substrate-binding protein
VTGTLAHGDGNLRATLQGGSGAAVQLNSLLKSVEPTLPVLLSNLVTVNQVTTVRLSALEQTLVTFPRVIASGFTGTSEDGYGHVNLQFAENPGACREGYKPISQWRPGDDLTDGKIYKQAHCASGPPYDMRGNKYAPSYGGSSGANRVAPYDARTGVVGSGDGSDGGITIGNQGGEHQIFGEDSWKWMLIGPLERR